ncbi:MAG: hypothetical protein ACI9R3_004602 [Verrucomicrobiales bacterium]
MPTHILCRLLETLEVSIPMKKLPLDSPLFRRITLPLASAALLISVSHAQELTEGMIGYWPLDEIIAGKSPDKTGNSDMVAKNIRAEDIVEGRWGNAYVFDASRSTILEYVSEVEESLPLDQYESFAISMWVKGDGFDQPGGSVGAGDRRVFSEGSTQNNNPLFNLGTSNNQNSEELDIFIRGDSGTVNHVRSEGVVFDNEWRHFVFVQNDNDYTVYVDGELSPVDGFDDNPGVRPIVADGQAYRVNTTTIGGIRRAAASHYFNGMIDDVAVWNRTLDADDVESLFTTGTPDPGVVAAPLEIKNFSAERLVVPAGEVAILRWEGSKDASYSVEPGVGNVDASFEFGVGRIEVIVTTATEFVLTATLGEETQTAEVSISVIPDIEPGWYLLGNFEPWEEGQVVEKAVPYWFNPDTTPGANISKDDEDTNQVLSIDSGQQTVFAELQTFAVPDGQKRSVFFQVYLRDGGGLQYNIGLTNKALRGFTADTDANLGGILVINRFEGDDVATLDLLTGETSDFELESETWYDIWIDTTNSEGDSFDTISVFAARAGEGAGREELFLDVEGDRGNGNDLVFFMVAAKAGNTGDNELLIDNVFISKEAAIIATNPFGVIELVDTDEDGIPDNYEDANDLDKNVNDAAGDKDEDGVSNLAEYEGRLLANNPDTDGDGRTDGEEVNGPIKSDPRKRDSDRDGLDDAREVALGTDPLLKDSDGDSYEDGLELLFGGNPTNSSINAGNFSVRNVQANVTLDSMGAFQDALADANSIDDEVTADSPVINFRDTADGQFGGNAPFPLLEQEDVAADDFGIHVTGIFFVSEPGVRTFGVNSDDGNQLLIDGEVVVEDPDTHGSRNRFGSVDLTAGTHTLEYYFYERGGGAHVELFVNTDLGDITSFNEGNFVLLPAAPISKAPFEITDFAFDRGANSATLTFRSRVGGTYSISTGTTLQEADWLELEDGLEATGESTSFTHPNVPADTQESYYRVIEQ